ncbi:MAG: CHASE3 domain-containing protein [Proteobacteria bacterium]|nr:CHASE3 domain-containing protein [Pseudomonadota bacterium]
MLQSKRRMLALVAFLASLATILAIGLISNAELSALANSSARVQRSYDLLQTLYDLNSALTDTETNQRGFLLTQNPAYLSQYNTAIAQIRLAMVELRRLSRDEPETQTAIDALETLAGGKLADLQESLQHAQAGSSHTARANEVQGKGKYLMEAFRRNSAALENIQRRILEDRRQQEQEARFFSQAVLVTTIVLSLCLVGAAAVISRRFDDRRMLLEQEIAERRRAEKVREALLVSERSARAEAERATRLKDEFVATLSHELRTPLNAIVGWASILRADRRTETVAQGVEVIERNSKLQAQLIEDLLDMSRILSGKLLFEPKSTDVAEVVEAAVAAVRPTADAKGVLLSTKIEPCRVVSADPARLQQVAWNLLTNAIKFTPRAGRVDITLRENTGQVELSVTDSGQGIRAEFLPFVFDRFRQADASTTRRHGGLGLGLSIVKSLVELHGGSVEAWSEGEGRGATFIVCLPIRLLESTEAANGNLPSVASENHGTPELAGLRILVVDDEDDARTLARRVLEERGALVTTVSSAAEAIASVGDNNPPSVIVSDIGMPEQDGYDLIKQMRALPGEAGRVPAVALTALARAEDRKRALSAGYQKHVSKPVDPAELVAVIASLAERALSARSS